MITINELSDLFIIIHLLPACIFEGEKRLILDYNFVSLIFEAGVHLFEPALDVDCKNQTRAREAPSRRNPLLPTTRCL